MNLPSFALRHSALLGLLVAGSLVLAACGDAVTPTDGADGGMVRVVDGVVEIVADDLEFDASVIQAPAGEAFTIRLTNNEAPPHNIAVFTEEGGELIARGAVIGEGETDELRVEALEAGEYFFVCEVHPEMTGTVVVEG